ncbi:MAG: hypothetical protein L0215_06750 [Gemmataceae bacterium]|nr:hypothetical protein [Gemmataceae bacterium]
MVPNWRNLVWLPENELARFDVAGVNLACAEGLPGLESFDSEACLRTIEEWAERVSWTTVKKLRLFEAHPERFYNSRDYFRVLTLVTVLQRDCGVRYNPAKISHDAPFTPLETFLFGITHGDGGTCATMPVLYVAVARRLGYPLVLVSAKGEKATHLFARWVDPGGHFNIEATAEGLQCPPDEHYRTGQYRLTADEEEKGAFLRSQSPRAELAGFLMERAFSWQDVGRHRRVVEAMGWACALEPKNQFYLNRFKASLNNWTRALEARKPAIFPRLMIKAETRRFPVTLPVEFEQDILGLESYREHSE